LTDAATLGKVDKLLGFKENVITGHFDPGRYWYRKNAEHSDSNIWAKKSKRNFRWKNRNLKRKCRIISSDVLDDVVEEKLVEEEE